MFAVAINGDGFCFDLRGKTPEYPVVHFNHETEAFEPFADNFAEAVRRFVDYSRFSRFILLFLTAPWPLLTCPLGAHAQDLPLKESDVAATASADEGPSAALAFEKSFRGEHGDWKPVPLEKCQNVQELTEELWSKKHVLADFEQFRTKEQVGAIVVVKTEYCCDDSRLCAVTTACMEKKSTPLIGRFRVYAAWIKNHPNHQAGRIQWDQQVIDEYDFIQGPGARIFVMVPTVDGKKYDGKKYEWLSDATDLELSLSEFESNNGRTPKLEQLLAEAVKYAPSEIPRDEPSDDG